MSIKSVTIKDDRGALLIKVLHRKSGEYEVLRHASCANVSVEIRDDKNRKVLLEEK